MLSLSWASSGSLLKPHHPLCDTYKTPSFSFFLSLSLAFPLAISHNPIRHVPIIPVSSSSLSLSFVIRSVNLSLFYVSLRIVWFLFVHSKKKKTEQFLPNGDPSAASDWGSDRDGYFWVCVCTEEMECVFVLVNVWASASFTCCQSIRILCIIRKKKKSNANVMLVKRWLIALLLLFVCFVCLYVCLFVVLMV